MAVNMAINGFGRIGRMVFRRAIAHPDLNIVAINARHPVETLVHLLKYDSIHGRFDGEVRVIDERRFAANDQVVEIVNDRDPRNLPWKHLDVDIVIEATGKFRTRETAFYHIEAGAKKVIITAPAKGEDATIVMGVNENVYNPEAHHILSNASCTTNCLAPVVKILDDAFGIGSGMVTTVHAYTNDQNNIDNPHKDLRRARACGQSIIPTTTGAAKAIGKVLPHLKGKMNGIALRVPTPNVSLVDLVVDLKTPVTEQAVNSVLKEAAETDYRGIVAYSEEPLVSVDYQTDPHSAVIDGLSTMVMGDYKVKVLAWYDNEWGYSCRVVDLAALVANKLNRQNSAKVG
ncbi:glyceraldehyde-3-phosphate dehydrogenase [Caenibacillus caldisaponilyticus]|jgi:glyceraldehyde 3-phosphate dehydrogenase|uniref:glyceraldehyde-3-phosphate dehydrogenase n=1 Tax=Caenibacillus caldisaponilyticus TaxID=1674942 RepID=UPI0009887E7C|nr:glyceraldehyde-3-phosphate dehydrogenase [Caenibacillus caldisaponilyticus]